jgi:hypothetical protein
VHIVRIEKITIDDRPIFDDSIEQNISILLILYYQVVDENKRFEKYDILAGFRIPDCNIVLSSSSEKYDILAGFRIPYCNIVLSSSWYL